ncbi:RsfA family transcriptional regulator [Bacillus luteolus]|uniref:RsfA family transcriptional regulator n=1 Tax=Litchfieldia luteola TaxID=682179 RepID=A0ABR9QHX3_9BACI|nr:RsfA family transcriptional regulator [Cytobacillus luteolus]MBE4908096.1 RsfA family transcriptional regulator [Cytobacillus luteolus]MBP1942881.1 prespore-specific regulator [Cytobacillus luteolus]
MKVRQDAWSHEDDLLLAETVLRYIREGGTQLAAFEEVGDKLNRTSAACGFRWNAEVRGKYDQAIAIAKKQRKERKRAMENNKKHTNKQEISPINDDFISPSFQDNFSDEKAEERVWFEELNNKQSQNYIQEYSTELLPAPMKEITLEDCISFLSEMKKQDRSSYQMTAENERLRRENNELLQKNRELEKQLKKLDEQQAMIQEDYQALVQIMDRARRMVLFEDHEDRKAPTFRMDKNGNLEVAK